MQSRIIRYGGLEQFLLEGPYDVFHDIIVCKTYIFADSQRSRLLFPVVDLRVCRINSIVSRF